MSWKFEEKVPGKTYVLPAGVYYVGDPCFIIKEEIYESVIGSTGYSEGIYLLEKSGILIGRISDDGAVGGSDTFKGSDGFEYLVDSGVIAIVSMSLADGDVGELAKMHKFTTEAYVTIENGIFTITSGMTTVIIDTNKEEEEEEEEDPPYASCSLNNDGPCAMEVEY